MSDGSQERVSPYVGPREFHYGEPLYGRDRETLKLLDLLIAERIVLVCSPSGAGKSSLIRAALTPKLEEENFTVLPVARVNTLAGAGVTVSNRYIQPASLPGGRPERRGAIAGAGPRANGCGGLSGPRMGTRGTNQLSRTHRRSIRRNFDV